MYSKYVNIRQTAQNEIIFGKEDVMAENNAGGFSFVLDKWATLNRFLILGTEGGTYYVSESNLTKENAKNLFSCIEEDGIRVINTIVDTSQGGRAPKNEAALFALAACASIGNEETRKEALYALPQVARTGTHLFQFVEFVQAFRGWGRSLRRAISQWYTDKNINSLMYQLIKYQSRQNWSHRDLLRLAHPKTDNDDMNTIFNYITYAGSKDESRQEDYQKAYNKIMTEDTFLLLQAFENVKRATSVREVVNLIREYRLPREAIPTNFLNERDVWEALLEDMPMTALIRNLGNLSKNGLLVQGNFDVIDKVVAQIIDDEKLNRARVHPLSILLAMATYSQGHGYKGSGTWPVVPDVVDALDMAFYMAFDTVEPTNKRTYIGLDVSGSMSWALNNNPLTCSQAANAMAMVQYKTEPKVVIRAFSDTMKDIHISRNSRLLDVMEEVDKLTFGMTDCSLPMQDALNNKLEIDTFIVYTDNETWYGKIHPIQALNKYREKMNIPARLVVVGMTATRFSIADPNDSGMLDVVGFDTATPQIISQFSKGDI